MYLYRDWTLDPISFNPAKFAEFLDGIHSANQYWIPIHDAAIYHPNPNNASDSEDYFTVGDQLNIWMLNPDNSTYIGDVWPGYTVFPDWLVSNTQSWWTEAFRNFSKIARFDGIWLDMNEVSSFCVGSCGSANYTQNPVHPPFKLPGEPGNIIYEYPEGFNLTNATEAAAASSASSSQAAASSTSSSTTASTSVVAATTATITPTLKNINCPLYTDNHHQRPRDPAINGVNLNAISHLECILADVTEAATESLTSSINAFETTAPTTSEPSANTTVKNINYPPYAINHHQLPHDLAVHAVSPNATHHDGTLEYDIHNIWGYLESRATYNSLTEINLGIRPFIITRSTFPGSGVVSGHWGGRIFNLLF